jgi:hypothetical protein
VRIERDPKLIEAVDEGVDVELRGLSILCLDIEPKTWKRADAREPRPLVGGSPHQLGQLGGTDPKLTAGVVTTQAPVRHPHPDRRGRYRHSRRCFGDRQVRASDEQVNKPYRYTVPSPLGFLVETSGGLHLVVERAFEGKVIFDRATPSDQQTPLAALATALLLWNRLR